MNKHEYYPIDMSLIRLLSNSAEPSYSQLNGPDSIQQAFIEAAQDSKKIQLKGLLTKHPKFDLTFEVDDEPFLFYLARSHQYEMLSNCIRHCLKSSQDITQVNEHNENLLHLLFKQYLQNSSAQADLILLLLPHISLTSEDDKRQQPIEFALRAEWDNQPELRMRVLQHLETETRDNPCYVRDDCLLIFLAEHPDLYSEEILDQVAEVDGLAVSSSYLVIFRAHDELMKFIQDAESSPESMLNPEFHPTIAEGSPLAMAVDYSSSTKLFAATPDVSTSDSSVLPSEQLPLPAPRKSKLKVNFKKHKKVIENFVMHNVLGRRRRSDEGELLLNREAIAHMARTQAAFEPVRLLKPSEREKTLKKIKAIRAQIVAQRHKESLSDELRLQRQHYRVKSRNQRRQSNLSTISPPTSPMSMILTPPSSPGSMTEVAPLISFLPVPESHHCPSPDICHRQNPYIYSVEERESIKEKWKNAAKLAIIHQKQQATAARLAKERHAKTEAGSTRSLSQSSQCSEPSEPIIHFAETKLKEQHQQRSKEIKAEVTALQEKAKDKAQAHQQQLSPREGRSFELPPTHVEISQQVQVEEPNVIEEQAKALDELTTKLNSFDLGDELGAANDIANAAAMIVQLASNLDTLKTWDEAHIIQTLEQVKNVATTALSTSSATAKFLGLVSPQTLKEVFFDIAGGIAAVSELVNTLDSLKEAIVDIARVIKYAIAKHSKSSEELEELAELNIQDICLTGANIAKNIFAAVKCLLKATNDLLKLTDTVSVGLSKAIPGLSIVVHLLDIARSTVTIGDRIFYLAELTEMHARFVDYFPDYFNLTDVIDEDGQVLRHNLQQFAFEYNPLQTLNEAEIFEAQRFALTVFLEENCRKQLIRAFFNASLSVTKITGEGLKLGGVSSGAAIGVSVGAIAVSAGAKLLRYLKQEYHNLRDDDHSSDAKHLQKCRMIEVMIKQLTLFLDQDFADDSQIEKYLAQYAELKMFFYAAGFKISDIKGKKMDDSMLKLIYKKLGQRE
ncbi:MAG: hypothetical protein ACPGUD_01065 [Parashewanella sp.]